MSNFRIGNPVTARQGYMMPAVDYDGQVVTVTAVSPCGLFISIQRPHVTYPSGYLPASKFKTASKGY